MRASQFSSALTFSSRLPAWPASSVASTWTRNRSAPSAQRVQRGVALAFVVGVEPTGRALDLDDVHAGEHAEAAHEIDRRAQAGMRGRTRRGTTASPAGSPGPTATPGWPSSSKRASTSRDASINACNFGAAGPVGHTAGLSDRSCGGVQSASAQSRGRHDDVAVLHARMERHAVAAELACRARRSPRPRPPIDGWPPAKSTIVPSSPIVTRLQRYATWSGRSRSPSAAASIGARPVWNAAGS